MVRQILSLVVLAASAGMQSAILEAQDTGRDRLLHYSLQVDVDEEARAQFAASESELSKGDVLTAVSRWRALLDTTPSGGLISFRETYVSVPAAVRSLLKSQSRETLQEYLRITEPIAARALQQATLTDDRNALRSVVERFPLTNAAEQASLQFAERSFDAGEFRTCQTTVDRWMDETDDPKAAVARHPEMLVLRTIALHSLGDASGADRVWSKLSDAVPSPLRNVVEAARQNRIVPAADIRVAPSPPTVVDTVGELFPSEDRIWSQDLTAAPPISEWTSLRTDFEELAHPLLMVNSPRASENGIVASGFGRRVLSLSGAPQALKDESQAAPIGTRLDAIESFRAALGESIFGRATVAGDRLYSIEPMRGRSSVLYSSRLTAHSVRTGEALWSLADFPVSAGARRASATILGPPLERSGLLVLPVQLQDQIELLAIDADNSRVRWQTRLGDAGLSLMADTRRRWMPAVMEVAGDAVLCATGNGAVASVEIETGHVRWIHRSQREDWRDAGPPPMSAAVSAPRFRMWTGWREPVVQTFDDVVVWAGPETNSLIALDRKTGELRWSQPRGDRLNVIANDSVLLTLAEDEVQRVNPQDGKPTWSAAITSPAGIGFSAAGWYVLPLRTGGTVALRESTGETVRSIAWTAEVLRESPQGLEELRSLSWTPRGIVVQTPKSVSLCRTVADLGRLRGDTTSTQQLAASGRLSDAVRGLDGGNPGASNLKVRLEAIAHETDRDQFHLVQAPAQQTEFPMLDWRVTRRLEAFAIDRRPETAASLIENCSLRDLSASWFESNSTPRRRVRADRLIAATLIETTVDATAGRVVCELSPAVRQRIDQLLVTLRSERPHEISAFFSLMGSTSWGASQLLLHHERPESEGLSARQQARRRLVLMHLAALDGDVGSRARQVLATLTPHRRPITDWPAGEIQSAPYRPWISFMDYRPITVDVLGQTELAGLDVDFRLNSFNDRKSGMIQFSGCGEDRPWAFDLPRTSRNLATSADYRLATVLGPLVVTQVGSGLFGFLAYDETGRGISNLWDVPWIDVWGRVATHSVNFLPRLSDVAPGRHPIDLDDFGRPLAQIGPITASYFCYREFDRLVACETSSGRRLWDRRHYDPDAFAVGADAQIILVSPSAHRIEIIDPLDGKTLLTRELNRPLRDWRVALDSLAILRSGHRESPADPMVEASELMGLDLATSRVLWRQPVTAEAIEFPVGHRLLGAVEKDSIRLFDASSGEERTRFAVVPPRDFTDVYAIDDPFAIMIGVFTAPAVEQLRPPLMLVGSRRRPYANGTVYGLDPKTLELKWTLTLDKSVFPLDQPRDIPLLLLSDAALRHDQQGNEYAEDRIRCFDKRTGRQVGPDLSGPKVTGQTFTVDRSQAEGWIQIRNKNGIFRFDFSAASER